MTARENKAMIAFTYEIDPEIAVSYHSAGRILYWNFRTPAANVARDKRLANIFTTFTGYSQVSPSYNSNGGGGYTDWFIQKLGRPAFTPEIGIKNGETNLPVSAFGEEWRRNKKIGLWIAQEGYALWAEKNKTTVKPVSVFLDGKRIAGDPAAFNEEGATYVSYKPLLTPFGYKLKWEGTSKSVTATGDYGTIRFALGKTEAEIDGKKVTLTAAPRLYEGEIYVPVRLISQATGATLSVYPDTGAVSIQSPPRVTAPPEVPAVPAKPVEPPVLEPPAETPSEPIEQPSTPVQTEVPGEVQPPASGNEGVVVPGTVAEPGK